MEVRVRVPSALSDLSGGRAVHALEVGHGATIAGLLDAIASAYPSLERRIRDEQGVLRPHVNVFVGDENVRSLAGAATILRAGDEVSILPAISGG